MCTVRSGAFRPQLKHHCWRFVVTWAFCRPEKHGQTGASKHFDISNYLSMHLILCQMHTVLGLRKWFREWCIKCTSNSLNWCWLIQIYWPKRPYQRQISEGNMQQMLQYMLLKYMTPCVYATHTFSFERARPKMLSNDLPYPTHKHWAGRLIFCY